MDQTALDTPPIALTIAGSDSSGGAGIQADLKTMTALGVYGASVITALTAQNTRGVTGVHATPADFVSAQLEAVFADLDPRAVKTGMLANTEIVHAVSDFFSRHRGLALIVDPVMVASSGDRLLTPAAIESYRRRLFPLARLITPNLSEAAVLLDEPIAQDLEAAKRQALALLSFGPQAVLVKGGHAKGGDATDVLVTGNGQPTLLSADRITTRNTHGTGCTLSAAIAALVARGNELEDAVEGAKSFLTAALAAGREQSIGGGHGPVDHMFDIRRRPPPLGD